MTPEDAHALLGQLGAPAHLVRHAELVREVASTLCVGCGELGVTLDVEFILAGATLHDVGKTRHLEELHVAGHQHEHAGQRLLLEHGVESTLARVCVSHAQWSHMDCSLEELVVALADKLWKGERVQALEERVILMAEHRAGVSSWDLYTNATSLFDTVAERADARLAASLGP